MKDICTTSVKKFEKRLSSRRVIIVQLHVAFVTAENFDRRVTQILCQDYSRQ